MEERRKDQEEIHSEVLRAGRRTYFFDVRATRADDYYLTITESKKFTNPDGSFYFKKHKIYLYKEDFEGFLDHLKSATNFVFENKGREIISEDEKEYAHSANGNTESDSKYTNIDFDDLNK